MIAACVRCGLEFTKNKGSPSGYVCGECVTIPMPRTNKSNAVLLAGFDTGRMRAAMNHAIWALKTGRVNEALAVLEACPGAGQMVVRPKGKFVYHPTRKAKANSEL